MLRLRKGARRPLSVVSPRLSFEFLEDRSVPATLTVNPAGGAMFTTIASAVAASADGDVIQLANGTYVESNIAVNHAVTIEGESESGVILEPAAADSHDDSSFGGAFQYAFIVQHDNVTITNLTIDGNANANLAGDHNYRGGIITDFRTLPDDWDNLTVQGVTIQHVYRRGIQISDVSAGHLISGNRITDVALAGNGFAIISLGGDGSFLNNTITQAANGIATNFADTINGTGPVQATIQGNTVSVNNGGLGLELFGITGGSTISGNTIDLKTDTGANIGILFGDSRNGSAQITGNTITGANFDAGIWVSETAAASQPTISQNQLISSNSTAANPGDGVGIYLTDDNTLTSTANGDTFAIVDNNQITGFNTGIELLNSTAGGAANTNVSATISNSTISGGANGITATGGIGDLTIDNVQITGGTGNGIDVDGAAVSTLMLDTVSITGNAGTGLDVTGFGTVTISDLTLTGGTNSNSIATAPGGTIHFTPSTTQAANITVSGAKIQYTAGGTTDAAIALSGESTLNVTGSSAADTFMVTPPAAGGAAINIVGGAPTTGAGTSGGDTLALSTTTGVNFNSTYTGGSGFSGTAGVTGAPNITFSGIESFTGGASISGTVFNDANGNGTQDAGEAGLAGVTVQLDLGANGTFEFSTTTDASGHYSFTGLPPGTYRVRVLPSAGVRQTTAQPADITANFGTTDNTVNFGLEANGTTGASTVTGIVFNDTNANGTLDAGETGLNGLTVYLDLNNNGHLDTNEPSTVSSTVNGVAGSYTLQAAGGGTTQVRVVEKPGIITNTSNANVLLVAGQTETVNVGVTNKSQPQIPLSQFFAVAVVQGATAKVEVFNGAGQEQYEITVPGNFPGGLRVAMGDVNNDGTQDVVVGTGPGTVATIYVYDGVSHNQIFSATPFESSFTAGVFLSVGDLTKDGIADIVVTPDQGGGPRVVAYRGGTFASFLSVLGINDPNFRGGARTAIGDVNGDGVPDLIVAAGFGGGPRVAIYNGQTVGNAQLTSVVNDFFVFESTLRNGVFVAAGDLDGDGFDDIVFGAGPGGGPRVEALSGKLLVHQGIAAALAAPLSNFFGGNVNNRNGIHVAVKDLNSNGLGDIVTGDGNSGHITGYNGQDGTQLFAFDVNDTTASTYGVFVG